MNDSLPITFLQASSFNHSSIILLIVILSILSFCGVIFMLFGPMMRSEAIKRVDNYVFGRDSTERANRMVDGLEQCED